VARTNLPLTDLTGNAGVLESTTAIDQPNGMNVVVTSEAIPAKGELQDVILIVSNTAAAAHNAIIRAGAGPVPAFRASLGDLTVSVTNATTQIIGPFESARFAQADGSLNLDFDVGMTGTVAALRVPRTIAG
jgi:hypothetical protein